MDIFKMLKTKRLILRSFKVCDALELFNLAKNVNVSYPCGFLPHKNVEDSKNVIVNVLQKPGIYAIFLKEKKVLIGCINLKFRNSSNLAVRDSEAELGFWIGEPFWKNGFAVEACILILRYAFFDLNLKKIWVSSMVNNNKSFLLQKKLGFKYLCSKFIYMPLVNETRLSNISFLTFKKFKKNFTGK